MNATPRVSADPFSEAIYQAIIAQELAVAARSIKHRSKKKRLLAAKLAAEQQANLALHRSVSVAARSAGIYKHEKLPPVLWRLHPNACTEEKLLRVSLAAVANDLPTVAAILGIPTEWELDRGKLK